MATNAYYIPNGPVNLASVFPMIDFAQVSEYFIELVDSLDVVIATTTLNDIKGCEDDDDKLRIHFLNGLGAIDAVNFIRVTREHEAKSDSFQTPIAHPLDKTAHFNGRFNVKGNETVLAVTKDYDEEDQEWLKEITASPLAWVGWPGSQGQSANFIPIKILDAKREIIKENDRHTYQFTIEFMMSHEQFIIRN